LVAPTAKWLGNGASTVNARASPICRPAGLVVGLRPQPGGKLKNIVASKVYLRSRENGHYYAGSNSWSADSSLAQDFDTVDNASRFARTEQLAGMEVVLRYGEPASDLVLTLWHQDWTPKGPERPGGSETPPLDWPWLSVGMTTPPPRLPGQQ
jgi:hypothetical protein